MYPVNNAQPTSSDGTVAAREKSEFPHFFFSPIAGRRMSALSVEGAHTFPAPETSQFTMDIVNKQHNPNAVLEGRRALIEAEAKRQTSMKADGVDVPQYDRDLLRDARIDMEEIACLLGKKVKRD